ncbi:glycosyltransferase [Fundidesulfovibrio butyratiphilus]
MNVRGHRGSQNGYGAAEKSHAPVYSLLSLTDSLAKSHDGETGHTVRILHLGKFAPPAVGGMESFLTALMDRQIRDGHRVHAVRLAASGGGSVSDDRPGVPLRDGAQDAPPRFADVPAVWPSGPAPFAPGYGAAVRDMVRQIRPDVVHAHLPNLSVLWSLPSASIPLVVHWHADVPPEALPVAARLAYPLYRPPLSRVLARAARIVCTSDAGRDASDALRKHRNKCVVVPLGIALDSPHTPERSPFPAKAEPERTVPQSPGGPLTVLGLGRFAAYKGFDILVRAAAQTPPPLRFVLAGDGPFLDATRSLADGLGLRDRIAFPGKVSDARRDRLLAECDIFCLPAVNRAEAFGLVALEAMSFSRPVVACSPAGSGVAEVVKHGATGLVVPPSDPASLARALTRLADSPNERLRMGQAGRHRLIERFDLSRVARALEVVYRQAVATRS